MSEAGSTGETGQASSDQGTDSSGGLLGTWPRRIAVGIVALIGLLAVLYMTGIIGAPTAGLADRGDWGTVTDERTEIVTTVWVNNPNPVGVALGNSLTADYDIFMNGVRLAEGSRSDITIPAGNDTKQLSTDLLNDRLAAWWVGFVRADETIDMDVNATLRVQALTTFQHDVSVNRTILADSTPVIDALSASVNSTSGTYAKSVDAGQLDDSLTDGVDLGGDSSVTVGYEVERGWATWDSVTESETTVLFHLRVHNPGDVPVPAAPDGLGVAIDTNDVRLFEGQSGDLSLRSVGTDAVIAPGETREVTFAVTMDNQQVDEWFTSHVRDAGSPGAEATAVSTQFQVVFEDPATGTTFRLPQDSPATHDCQFATQILVDEQPVETTCGEGPVAPDGESSGTSSDTASATATDTAARDGGAILTTVGDAVETAVSDVIETSTPVATPPPTLTVSDDRSSPTARLTANVTEGSAPLSVSFDASDSSDPDGDIEEYVWTGVDGDGQTRVRTFERAGVYTVTVTVIDSTGRSDTASVTVRVSP